MPGSSRPTCRPSSPPPVRPWMTAPLSTALTMSITVSAATGHGGEGPPSRRPCDPSSSRWPGSPRRRPRPGQIQCHTGHRQRWHSGIRSGVRLAPMIPAMRAVARASPWAPPRRAAARSPAVRRGTRPLARAVRAVTSFPDTSTMRAAPASVEVRQSVPHRAPGVSPGRLGHGCGAPGPGPSRCGARACCARHGTAKPRGSAEQDHLDLAAGLDRLHVLRDHDQRVGPGPAPRSGGTRHRPRGSPRRRRTSRAGTGGAPWASGAPAPPSGAARARGRCRIRDAHQGADGGRTNSSKETYEDTGLPGSASSGVWSGPTGAEALGLAGLYGELAELDAAARPRPRRRRTTAPP